MSMCMSTAQACAKRLSPGCSILPVSISVISFQSLDDLLAFFSAYLLGKSM